MSYWKKYNYYKNPNLNKSFSKYQNNNNNNSSNIYGRKYYKNRSRSRDFDNREESYHNQKSLRYKSSSKDSYSQTKSDENSSHVDRAKTCPFLIRVFYKKNEYNALKLFRDEEFPPELNIYTWEDADLKEIADLIYSALKGDPLGRYDVYKFSSVFYDTKGKLIRKGLGSVDIKNDRSKFNHNSTTTLKKFGFNIGDYLDVIITWGEISNK